MLLEDLQVILKVAEFKSITAAAHSLDMRTATASAAIKRVEKHLGSELFVRTTRQLRISSAGEHFLPQCEKALSILQQARNNLGQQQQELEGELRLSISSDLGRNIVLPWLDELMDSHPKLSLKLTISDRNVDFYRDSVDVALRYGFPHESNMVGFKICDVNRLLCASKGYLEQFGTPLHPQELSQHNGLFYQLGDITHNLWEFQHQGEQFKVRMKGNRVSNDADLVRRWCVAGKGLASKSCLDMSNDLLQGNVVSLMQEYCPAPTELWLICPSKHSITPAVRQLRDQLRTKCQQIIIQLKKNDLI